jgi:hypothetical protein
MPTIQASKADVISYLWHSGDLRYKLYKDQEPIYDFIKEKQGLVRVVNCHRRRGKSTILFIDALETALQKIFSIILYIGPTQREIRAILQHITAQLFVDKPKEIDIHWNSIDGCYDFNNGSKIYVIGTDNKRYEAARGLTAHKAYVDEAAFCTDLDYFLGDILVPQTMTTDGNIILSSTPPTSVGHDFYFIAQEAISKGNYLKLDFDSCTHIEEEKKEMYIEEAGGRENTTCRREYFCEFVTDTENAVLPEFDDKREKELVRAVERPKCYDLYGSMDPGFNDFTAYLLGYYDFMNARYVIEGEEWFNHQNTEKVAKRIKELEKDLFPEKKVFLRVSDTSLQLICDLAELHGIQFNTTRKDDKEAAVNYVRTVIQNGKILIHPRCVNLIRQMKTAIWNNARTKYERTEKEGHFDLIDALVYFLRNVDRFTNPYPNMPEWVRQDTHFINQTVKDNRGLADLMRA